MYSVIVSKRRFFSLTCFVLDLGFDQYMKRSFNNTQLVCYLD